MIRFWKGPGSKANKVIDTIKSTAGRAEVEELAKK